MKKVLLFVQLALICCIGQLYSQSACPPTPVNNCDLVDNGNLEANTGMPINGSYSPSQLPLACGWSSGSGATPDYFNAGAAAGNTFDVPNNVVGSESAHSGNGYAGFATLFQPPGILREYAVNTLRCQLIANVTYTLSMWVSLADNSAYQGEVSAAVCAALPPGGGTGPIAPVGSIMPAIMLNQHIGWTQLNFTFVASGGEQFVIIGNFNAVNTNSLSAGTNDTYPGAYVYVDDVSLTPVQNLTISASPSPVACGSTTTLTNNYGAQIMYGDGTWSAGPVVSTATPPITGSTLFMGIITYCTGCTQMATTTVGTTPLPVGVHNPGPVCPGSCVTLNATGATNYVWNPGGLTGSSVTVCPPGPTTYTVNGTNPNGCSGATTVAITMAPTPTITATATPSTLTPPTATTSYITTSVSGGSGFTYSWAPATGLSSTTAANPVATPTATTIYTVTVTNSAGCTSTTTVAVTVTPQSPCTLPYSYDINGGTASAVFPSMSGLNGQNIRISGVFTIDVAFNFGGCNIVMEPNSRIEVAAGGTLLITNRTHIYACDSMWDGINLQSGSSAQIMNASIIEDAKAAITVNSGSSAILDRCILNRNYTAVKVTANASATTPVSMTGCVVTCRDLQLDANTVLNPSAATAWSNIVSNVYDGINMKWPFYGYRSIYGVQATDVNMLQIGNVSSPDAVNGFDTLMAAGIHLTRTNALVYNNKFRNFISTFNLYTPLIGTGVYATGSTTTAYTLKVGGTLANQPNDFYNINTSVDAAQYTVHVVSKNVIFNTSSTTATWGGFGKVGVRITPSRDNTINVSDNVISNCASGIIVNRNNVTATQVVSLVVDRNQVSASLPGFCNTAISLTDPTATVALTSTLSEINTNTISQAVTCINLANVKTQNTVYFNSCMTIYAPTGSRNGIKLVNCQNQTIVQNHTKYNVTTASTPGANILAYGISLLDSPSNILKCNTVEDAARSLVFSGNCYSPHNITQNTMRRAQHGLVLLTTATDIGTQGTSTSPSNNYWDMTFPMITQIVSPATAGVIIWYDGPSTGAQTVQPTTWSGGGLVLAFSAPGFAPIVCAAVPARMTQPEAAPVPISVFPNPNNGLFNIACSSDAPKDVYVYDMNGRLVYSNIQTTETNLAIDISSESKGLYMVKVVTDGNVQTEKISNQ